MSGLDIPNIFLNMNRWIHSDSCTINWSCKTTETLLTSDASQPSYCENNELNNKFCHSVYVCSYEILQFRYIHDTHITAYNIRDLHNLLKYTIAKTYIFRIIKYIAIENSVDKIKYIQQNLVICC